jgi:hypothetical protein
LRRTKWDPIFCTYFYKEPFLATNFQKHKVPQVPLEVTVINEVLTRTFSLGTLFLTVFAGELRVTYFIEN